MKTIKTFLLAMICISMAACMSNDDSYQAGFPMLATKYAYRYANNTSDTLFVQSYGSWSITRTSAGGEWCTPTIMQGGGYTTYGIVLNFSQNETGSQRSASFRISDKEHAEDAYVDFNITQQATRGDGSLGNARLVKSVTGSDNSLIDISYDEACRPLTFQLSKDNSVLTYITFSYNDKTGVMTATSNNQQLTASCKNDYQPISKLSSANETVAYLEQDYFNLTSNHYAFNIEHRKGDGSYDGYSYLLLDRSTLAPDKLHNADSLCYTRGKNEAIIETLRMKPSYSQYDNRCQSLDVNQLLLGVERCNPYMLLSLFRTARNTSIFDVVKVNGGSDIKFSTTLNNDKSVKELAVSQGSDTITYTFEY